MSAQTLLSKSFRGWFEFRDTEERENTTVGLKSIWCGNPDEAKQVWVWSAPGQKTHWEHYVISFDEFHEEGKANYKYQIPLSTIAMWIIFCKSLSYPLPKTAATGEVQG